MTALTKRSFSVFAPNGESDRSIGVARKRNSVHPPSLGSREVMPIFVDFLESSFLDLHNQEPLNAIAFADG